MVFNVVLVAIGCFKVLLHDGSKPTKYSVENDFDPPGGEPRLHRTDGMDRVRFRRIGHSAIGGEPIAGNAGVQIHHTPDPFGIIARSSHLDVGQPDRYRRRQALYGGISRASP